MSTTIYKLRPVTHPTPAELESIESAMYRPHSGRTDHDSEMAAATSAVVQLMQGEGAQLSNEQVAALASCVDYKRVNGGSDMRAEPWRAPELERVEG